MLICASLMLFPLNGQTNRYLMQNAAFPFLSNLPSSAFTGNTTQMVIIWETEVFVV